MRQVRRPLSICFYLYFLLAVLFRQVLNSVCSPGWPLTCSPPTFTYVALASSTSRLLGLFVCATTSDFILLYAENLSTYINHGGTLSYTRSICAHSQVSWPSVTILQRSSDSVTPFFSTQGSGQDSNPALDRQVGVFHTIKFILAQLSLTSSSL